MSRGLKPSIGVGDKYTTNQNYEVEVVEYNGSCNIVVMFDTGFKKVVSSKQIKTGKIGNPFHQSVFGVGCMGDGPYKSKINRTVTKCYQTWKSMLNRVYNDKMLEKQPTYRDCSVCAEWHNFQNFAEWYYRQPNANKQGYHLDKDLLVIGNRVYSPETCSLLPSQINTLLNNCGATRGVLAQGIYYRECDNRYKAHINMGNGVQKHLGLYRTPEEAFAVYRQEKEKFVREQAEKYKDVLHPKVYENLMNWSLDDI
jgi:hypothetical protein